MANPYKVVTDFEAAIAEYTCAKHVVCVNSCSSAIFLALARQPKTEVMVPTRTYASVPMAVIHAGHKIKWNNVKWNGSYWLHPFTIMDSARKFHRGMCAVNSYTYCVSFQTSKILGIEQGGAILHFDDDADDWYRRARFDGRLDHTEKLPKQIGWHCYMNPSTAAQGIAKLATLPDNPPDNGGSYLFEDLSKLDIWK